MKKLTILTMAVAGIILAGCTEFLNIRPEGTTTSEGLDYANADNIIKPVSAAYAQLRSYNCSAFPFIGCLEVTSDDADKGSTPEDGASMKELQTFTYGASNELILAQWTGWYDVVSAANNVLDQMEQFKKELQLEENLAVVEQCIGDAKFIRAYAYFYLVRMWGNIPLVDKTMSASELASLQQKTPAQIYEFIEADLQDAIDRLPSSWPRTYISRANKYTAMAYKAKVHLYQGEYDQAASLCDAIIASGKYALMPDFRYVFSMEGENCQESVFEIESSALGKTTGDAAYSEYAYHQGPRNNTPSTMQGWGFCTPSESLVAFLTARGDTERMATTLLYRGSTTPEGDYISEKCPNPIYNGKVYTPSTYNKWNNNGYGYDHNLRAMRYSEVLLMYAEALARGAAPGTQSGFTAATALDMVRSRVGLESTEPSLDNILDERRAELALEEDRFLDLIRTGRAAEVLAPLGYIEGKNNLFPIPATQLQLNTNLHQNPNYL